MPDKATVREEPDPRELRAAAPLHDGRDAPDVGNHLFISDEVVYQTLAEHFRQDLEMFWARANFYLLIQVGLLSVVATIIANESLTSTDRLVSLGLCGVGLVLAVFWFLVLRGAVHWIAKWREQVMMVDASVSRFHCYATVEATHRRCLHLSPSVVTSYLPAIFIVVWIAAGIVVFMGA